MDTQTTHTMADSKYTACGKWNRDGSKAISEQPTCKVCAKRAGR